MSSKEPAFATVQNDSNHLKQRIRQRAEELGFDAVGFARADLPLDSDYDHYLAYIEQGFHGDMNYLAEFGPTRQRLDTGDILLGAKTVICLAKRYNRPEETPSSTQQDNGDLPLTPTIARYARGRDYHGWVRDRIRRIASLVRTLGANVQARPMVDTAPVLEKAWAARSGLGFLGKNNLIIIPGKGSYTLLGEVVTTLDLAPDDPIEQRCGQCTRCLDICPTQAFVRPFVLDARKCIAYMTIEQRSLIEPNMRSAIGVRTFGCDLCQEVCPFNKTAAPNIKQTSVFAPLEHWESTSLATLLEQQGSIFSRIQESTPVKRIEDIGLLKMSIIAAANGRLSACLEPIRRLIHHDDPEVRQYARWAVEQFETATKP